MGTGLIGTSIALALRARGVDVTLADRDPEAVRLAVERGGGSAWTGRREDVAVPGQAPDVVVIATPPSVVVDALIEAQGLHLDSTLIDVASVKSQLLGEAQSRGVAMTRYVPTHPIAGRERGGPVNARTDLFAGRNWVLTPVESTSHRSLAMARRLVELCGAVPVVLTDDAHDAAMALVSHVPQLVASALAAEAGAAPEDLARLAGQGMRDMTRIADSDAALWRDICVANAAHVGPALRRLAARLTGVADAMATGEAPRVVERLVSEGNAGRRAIGSKHGRPMTSYEVVTVLLVDRPGELASVFATLGNAALNIEDVRIDHAPGEAIGVLELVIGASAGEPAAAALRSAGWTAQVSRTEMR